MTNTIQLPLAPDMNDHAAMKIYARFMRHLRNVPNSRMEIKTLSAIQFTADMLDHSDAHIAKTLVDLGLRAPRMAFPAEFLNYADQALMREKWEIGGASQGLAALHDYWLAQGEDRFAGVKRSFPYALPRTETVPA